MSGASDFSGDEELLNQFLDYAGDCSAEMRSFLNDLLAAPARTDLLDQLYTGAHNLKGMSGSFGFELLTDIASLMCLFIKKLPENADLNLMNSLMKAIETILEHKIAGDGGEKGTALKNRLDQRVNEAIAG